MNGKKVLTILFLVVRLTHERQRQKQQNSNGLLIQGRAAYNHDIFNIA
jgi:hypothetical protein